jgi:hypothetical protein
MFIGPAGFGPKTDAKGVVALRTNGDPANIPHDVENRSSCRNRPGTDSADQQRMLAYAAGRAVLSVETRVRTPWDDAANVQVTGQVWEQSPPSAAIRTYPGHGGASAPQSVSPASFRIALTWSERRL